MKGISVGYYRLFISIIIISCVQLCHAKQEVAPQQDVWLTVFVHGTVALRSQLNLSTVIRLIQDNITDLSYIKTISAIRGDPFFYQTQSIQELGLVPVNMNPSIKQGAAASAFARLFQENLPPAETDTQNIYYTYGWSGLLSHSERYKEAEKFYYALQQQIAIMQQQHPLHKIHIRLVCYSHGGSVALNIATVQDKAHPQQPISIDELILLGLPVQRETDSNIFNPIFKKIYHFYSRKDVIQTMDCFSLQRFFSNRRFRFKHQSLPDKLVQIDIRIKTNKSHHRKRYKTDRSPTHTELWFFGWTFASYRTSFPFNPLPLGVLAPSCIEMIKQHTPDQTHIVMELQPNGIARLRKRHHSHAHCVPWIAEAKLEQLKQIAQTYVPETLNIFAYKAHVRQSAQSIELNIPVKDECLCGIGLYDIPQCKKIRHAQLLCP